jgi:hypothetical protein
MSENTFDSVKHGFDSLKCDFEKYFAVWYVGETGGDPLPSDKIAWDVLVLAALSKATIELQKQLDKLE